MEAIPSIRWLHWLSRGLMLSLPAQLVISALLRQDLDAVARASHCVLDLFHHLLYVSSRVRVDVEAERPDIDRPDTVIRRQDGIDHAAQDLAVEATRAVAQGVFWWLTTASSRGVGASHRRQSSRATHSRH